MTDWDKLWEEPWASYTKYSTTEYYDYEIWVNQVRAVGDEMQVDLIGTHELNEKQFQEIGRLQKENTQLKKDVKELANMGSDDLHKRLECEKLMQLANSRCNELAKQLGETQEKLEFSNQNNEHTLKHYKEALVNWTVDVQKLEAIRGIIEYEDVTECIEKIQHVLDGGVLKEMQKEEQA